MSKSWDWADEIWQRAFAAVPLDGMRLERVELPTYWQLHEEHLREHFPPEAFINTPGLRSDAVKQAQERLADSRGGETLVNPCVVRQGERVVATFIGEMRTPATYRMWHSAVHPEVRRRGLYRRIIRATIAYTKEMGFDTIVSEHAPGNNPVLIAKMSEGFRIVGFDVEPMVGVSVHLCYFHNEDQHAAYEYRCGLATMNPRILEQGAGAMGLLARQFRGDD